MVRFNIAVLKESLEPIVPKAAMQGLDAEFVQEHQRYDCINHGRMR